MTGLRKGVNMPTAPTDLIASLVGISRFLLRQRMGSLSQFDFDLFLSYGWSGIENQEHGDRGWVGKLKNALAVELAGNSARKARIFLDVENRTAAASRRI